MHGVKRAMTKVNIFFTLMNKVNKLMNKVKKKKKFSTT